MCTSLVNEAEKSADVETDDFKKRQEVRDERKRQREDDRRDAMKKSKTSRDRERDISETIALGQAGRITRQGDSLYDSRLFNQDQVRKRKKERRKQGMKEGKKRECVRVW